MPALATLTLVWLGAQTPDPAASAALEQWAKERSAKLEDPRREPAAEEQGAASVAERCEAWLEQARDQVQAGDDAAAQGLLAQLDQNLRQHPELLQAGWLMAERYRLQARIARRVSQEQALGFEQLAEITEGARAPAFGESTATRAPVAKVHVALAVHGARRHEIYWDGSPSGDDFFTAPGEHHLLVFRGGRVAWAGWVNALATGKVDVWVPDAPACSAEDFEGVRLGMAAHVSVPPGVRCASWVAAAPADDRSALTVAVCSGDRCQPSATLSYRLAIGPAAGEGATTKAFLPPWAAWTLAGVGAAAATTIVLWRTGVFDTAPQSKLVYDGTNL